MPYVAKKTIEEYLNDIKGTDTKKLAQEINKAVYNYTGYKDNLKETKSTITKEDMPDFAELLHAIREKLIDLDEKVKSNILMIYHLSILKALCIILLSF